MRFLLNDEGVGEGIGLVETVERGVDVSEGEPTIGDPVPGVCKKCQPKKPTMTSPITIRVDVIRFILFNNESSIIQ